MKILVTGHLGYVGSVVVPMLRDRGHRVVGWDTGLYADCGFGRPAPMADRTIRGDLRDGPPPDLEGVDAVLHLAALSNDPLGNLRPDLTRAINEGASIRLARWARGAGVERFVFASSCSLYGVADDDAVAEDAAFHPVTAYGWSKVRVEQALSRMAGDDFSPTFLRNATAYGASPSLRTDIVVNNLVAWGFTTGEIRILSDGRSWRPLVHVEDIALACVGVLEARRELVHNEAFNVGRTDENFRVRELADMVAAHLPGTRVTIEGNGDADRRSYRVDCGKLHDTLPEARPRKRVADGIAQLVEAYGRHGLTGEAFRGGRYTRLSWIRRLLDEGRVDGELRWLGRLN